MSIELNVLFDVKYISMNEGRTGFPVEIPQKHNFTSVLYTLLRYDIRFPVIKLRKRIHNLLLK